MTIVIGRFWPTTVILNAKRSERKMVEKIKEIIRIHYMNH